VFIYSFDNDDDVTQRNLHATEADPAANLSSIPDFEISDFNADSFSCNDLLLDVDDYARWKKTKRNQISQFLIERHKQGLSEPVLDYIALESGLGVTRGRIIRQEKKDNITTPRFETNVVNLAPPIEDTLVIEAINSGDMEQLKNVLSKNKIPKEAFYAGKDSLVSIISLVIESSNEPSVELGLTIDMLINEGFEITYTDLITAIKYHLPIETLNDLYKSSNLNATQIFKKYGKYTSLSLLSLFYDNVQASLYWNGMGSSFKPDEFGLNGFDLLFKPNFIVEDNEKDAILNALKNDQIFPSNPQTLEKLNGKVNSTWYDDLKKKFSNNSFGLSKDELDLANNHQAILFSIILDGRVNFDIGNSQKSPCFEMLAKRLMKELVRKERKNPAKIQEDE
jgi:hypothetical protein